MGKQYSSLPKADRDNRSNQLNPNNPAYWGSRGAEPPAAPGAAPANGTAPPTKGDGQVKPDTRGR